MNKTILFFTTLICLAQYAFATSTDTVKVYGKYYCPVEYPGGADSLTAFVERNLKYPEAARDNNVEGREKVQFIVDENGEMVNPRAIRGLGAGCAQEALRVARLMPRWIPATYDGVAIKSVQTLVVTYILE
jgi:periplasmic protein TonB